MSKVVLLALSCDRGRLKRDLYESSSLSNLSSRWKPSHAYKLKVITQGFQECCDRHIVETIRDDRFYKKGLTISEIRNNLNEEHLYDNPDYVLFIDDDMKFGRNFIEMLDSHITWMNRNPQVGFMNFRYGQEILDRTPIIRPDMISMKSGMLVRMEAYNASKKYEPYVKYHEECILGSNIYLAGYDIYNSYLDLIHNRDQMYEGLGSSLKRSMDVNKDLEAGRNRLLADGIFESYNGMKCRFSEEAMRVHESNKMTEAPDSGNRSKRKASNDLKKYLNGKSIDVPARSIPQFKDVNPLQFRMNYAMEVLDGLLTGFKSAGWSGQVEQDPDYSNYSTTTATGGKAQELGEKLSTLADQSKLGKHVEEGDDESDMMIRYTIPDLDDVQIFHLDSVDEQSDELTLVVRPIEIPAEVNIII